MENKTIDNIVVIIFIISIIPVFILSIIYDYFFLIGIPFISYGIYCYKVQRAWVFARYSYLAKKPSMYFTGEFARKIAMRYIIWGALVMIVFFFFHLCKIRVENAIEKSIK